MKPYTSKTPTVSVSETFGELTVIDATPVKAEKHLERYFFEVDYVRGTKEVKRVYKNHLSVKVQCSCGTVEYQRIDNLLSGWSQVCRNCYKASKQQNRSKSR